VEQLLERLEELLLDVFIAVLIKLNERGKEFFTDEKERNRIGDGIRDVRAERSQL